MGLTKRKLAVCLILSLFAACSQLFVTSVAVFSNSAEDQELMLLVREKVTERIDEEGGNCKLNGLGDDLLRCLTPSKMRIVTGFGRDGELYIYIESGIVRMLPPSQSRLDDGSYLPSEQENWENWINSEFHEYEFEKKSRRTTGGSVQTFDTTDD